jgi:hypothetical protein
VNDLPRTRTGKVVKRVLRQIAKGSKDLGDLSSIENVSSLDSVIEMHKQKYGRKEE